jgi:hypothetical protein
MEYDCSQMQLQASNTFNPEKPDLIRGLGKPVIDLNHGKKKPEKGNPQTMMSAGLDYFFDKLGTFMLSKSTYAVPMSNAMDTKGKYMLGILNARGDTLTTFRKFEQLTNFTKSVMRNTDMGSNYEYGGKMFIRSAFNDTVFQVIPPNRLLPVYVLKLGKHKLSMQEGEDLDFDLTGKIIPEGWAETKDYVFITFSMNGNDCPNNRKSGKLSTFYAIYSRATRKLTIVRSNPKDYSAEVLLNDLDGGVPVWPLSYQVSSKDELLIPLRGKDLKARVKSDEFRKSKAPSGKKEELIKMAQLVRDNDDILMIVTLK